MVEEADTCRVAAKRARGKRIDLKDWSHHVSLEFAMIGSQ